MASKYEHLNRDQLLALLERRDREERRFGLVWERDEIEHEKLLNDDFVVLDLLPELAIGEAPWRNLLIEANNFDALRYLRMTFTGRIKCILIDPPYNTGNQDFIYNDRFVDKDDRYRHSKWLEMMFRTLTLARDLLSEDGVIFVNIGEEEFARLDCLMEEVFPGRRVAAFVWRRRSGANDSKNYFASVDHEYVLCYANPLFSFEGDIKSTAAYTSFDAGNPDPWVSSDLGKRATYKQRPNTFYPVQNPDNGLWYSCDPENVWAYALEARLKSNQKTRSKTIDQIIRDKKVLWPPNEAVVTYSSVEEIEAAIRAGTAPRNLRLGNPNDAEDVAFWRRELEFWVGKPIGYGKPRYKRHLSELKRNEKPLSTWILPASMKAKDVEALDLDDITAITSGYTSEGTSTLQQMLGHKDFPYPKPLSLIQALVKQATGPDDIVLDFFAGSCTMGHAVLAQNAADEGQRRFILVSSTEATEKEPHKNVCRDIAQKRLAAAIDGYTYTTNKGPKSVEGLGDGCAYARTRRVPVGKVVRRVQHDQVWLALQLMYLPSCVAYHPGQVQQGTDEKLHLFYVPDTGTTLMSELHQVIEHIESGQAVLIYTWQPATIAQQSWPDNVTIHPIPQSLTERFGLRHVGVERTRSVSDGLVE